MASQQYPYTLPNYQGGAASASITVPSSGTYWLNPLQCLIQVFWSGGTVTEVQFGRNGVWNNAGTGAAGGVMLLGIGDSIIWTYSAVPTARYAPMV